MMMNEYLKNNSRKHVQRRRALCEYGAIEMLYFIIILTSHVHHGKRGSVIYDQL